MPLDFESSPDASAGGAFLREPGTYHMIVVDSQEQATDKNGAPLGGFRVSGQVVTGTVPGQKGKQVDLLFFNPKPTDKNEGAFARKKQTRCLIALAKMHPGDVGKRLSIDLTADTTNGRQFVATLEKEEGKDYLRLHFADVFHVDDPEAAGFPKDAALIGQMPAEWRLKPEDFGQAGANGSGNGSPKSSPSQPKQTPASSVNLDDI